ncbi:dipeptidyl peptidase [Podospora fimiseda]|uniref:Dipeptidyl-peptidase V n=1 Tax=Podospora fimiseda TaxID=252190 RepID=A0AAN7H5F8_9PEZI|nr:dipeptidyl peptidase [Podospora fimiseda]
MASSRLQSLDRDEATWPTWRRSCNRGGLMRGTTTTTTPHRNPAWAAPPIVSGKLLILCFILCFFSLSSRVEALNTTNTTTNMTLTQKFTPQVLLSAPRRSPAIPNSDGTLALYTVSTYSFEEHKRSSQIKLLRIGAGQSATVVEDNGASEPVWVGVNEFIFLKGGDNGTTNIFHVEDIVSQKPKITQIASIDGGVSSVKVGPLGNNTLAFVVSGLATPEGKLYNSETAEKPLSSARVYTSLFVRHWDSWNTENVNSLFYSTLVKKDGKWTLSGQLINALAGTGLSSPVPPFGGTGDFDISPSGLVFVAKDPELDPAIYTKTNLYYIPLKTFTESSPPAVQTVKTPGLEGYSNSPLFSHSGTKVAFTRMKSNQYESDKTRLLVVPDISDLSQPAQEFYATEDGEGGWDARPDAILWGEGDKELFVTAERTASTVIYKVPSNPSDATDLPELVPSIESGSVSDIKLLSSSNSTTTNVETRLFVSSTSLTDNSCYSIANPSLGTFSTVSSNSKNGRTFGLSRSQVSDISFQGAGDYTVHALVMKPSDFDSKKKYPLAFLIHGGPQGAWADSWSTRWNPAIFAEQGYVVVAPNPTGSTGYGMALQNGIRGEWGGRPYKDLEKAFEYIEENLGYVDTDRAVALGASYGGYMINWVQGHPLGRKFKALVNHDGVFSTLNQWTSEELFFPIHDFKGTLYDNREEYAKWDPALYLNEWATPQLIIHSELDYRLPVTEGLAVFNVLQAKKVESKLLVFPDENHWVLKAENSLVWHREVLGWINKYSGVEEEQKKLEARVVDLVDRSN